MHWRLQRIKQQLECPFSVTADESEQHGDKYGNIGGGSIVDAIMFIQHWYNDNSGYRLFTIDILGIIKFKFRPSTKWADDRGKERIEHKRHYGVWPDDYLPYEYLRDYHDGEYCKASFKQQQLEAAVKKYYDAMIATNACPELCLSTPYRGTEAASLMQEMYQAQSELFELVGIDYHGGTVSGRRED